MATLSAIMRPRHKCSYRQTSLTLPQWFPISNLLGISFSAESIFTLLKKIYFTQGNGHVKTSSHAKEVYCCFCKKL